ncbi:MAG: PilZ domain-containing protein [Proteobacteria bacterium]|nr:PilZ domain-containing protein [Pseudomonadota bacterium]
MGKNITICFRTSEDLRNELKKISKEERRTLSSTIETIIYQYLQNGKKDQNMNEEKRRYPRKQVSLPALVSKPGSNDHTIQAGIVLDLSLNGIQVSIPNNYKYSIQENAENGDTPKISIIFTLPDSKKLLTMQCTPRHVYNSKDETNIGANFVDTDFAGCQTLQSYLIN